MVEDKRTTNCNSRNNWPACYLLIISQIVGELPKSKVNKMIYSCWEHILTLAEKHSYHIALNPSAIFSHNQSCFCNSENSFLWGQVNLSWLTDDEISLSWKYPWILIFWRGSEHSSSHSRSSGWNYPPHFSIFPPRLQHHQIYNITSSDMNQSFLN